MIWLKMIGKMLIATISFVICMALIAGIGSHPAVSVAAVLLFFAWIALLILIVVQAIRDRRPPAGPEEEPKEVVALDPEPVQEPKTMDPVTRYEIEAAKRRKAYFEELRKREESMRAELARAEADRVERDKRIALERAQEDLMRAHRNEVIRREQKDRAEELKEEIEQAFAEYGLTVDIVHIEYLDNLTRFEFYPEAGKRIIAYSKLADDVALKLGAGEKPLIDRVPGKQTIGVTVINSSVGIPDFE